MTDIPISLRTTIAQELTGIAADTLDILHAGAVAGDPFDVGLVIAITDADETRVLRCLDELVARDLVRATSVSGQFRFRQPIVRRVVYDETMPGWRFGAHMQAARALARCGAPLWIQAVHVERSATPGDEEAATILTQAGRAVASHAPATAARWFKAALRLLPVTSGTELQLELTVMLADALASAGQMGNSRAALEQALKLLATDSRIDRARILCMIVRAEHGLGRTEEARKLLVTALDAATAATAESVELELKLAENHLMCRQWEQAVMTAAHAHAHAQALDNYALSVAASSSLALFTSEQGDVVQANELADSIVAGMDSSDRVLAPELLEPLANLVFAEIYLHRLREADRHAERGLSASWLSGHGHAIGRLLLGAATTKLLLGQLPEAARAIESALETAFLLDNDPLRTSAESLRCWLETLSGNLPAALAAGRAAVQAADRRPGAHYAWLARVCHGQALVEAGELERGRQEILSVGGPELSDVPPAVRPLWLQVLVTAELSLGRLSAAEAITHQIEDFTRGLPSSSGHAFHARACVHAAQGDFWAAAASARRARECFDALEMRVWAARARLEEGRALARADEPAAAVRQLELAFGTLGHIGAVGLADEAAKELRTLGKRVRRRLTDDGKVDLADLTNRERDVAERVVQGYTNREIAAELFVSPKTVEKHLARVFAKLGASSRAGVATAIHRRTVGLRSGVHPEQPLGCSRLTDPDICTSPALH
ncbi:helix-turn-helix transcriptional regulator [Nocardia abscessus]|uniref:helix-turn-helix transcriptional regulator n=1 Tax=Nocardia abscessus TaxID=120957 RepID=UPI002B4B3A43|nr:LuxR C-terminal-related transcriptional regulator [Nocardia abscessus]